MKIIVTLQDTRHPSSYVCRRMRFWFRRHGLDYDDFKKNGIDHEKLIATGDQQEKIEALKQTALKRIGKAD